MVPRWMYRWFAGSTNANIFAAVILATVILFARAAAVCPSLEKVYLGVRPTRACSGATWLWPFVPIPALLYGLWRTVWVVVCRYAGRRGQGIHVGESQTPNWVWRPPGSRTLSTGGSIRDNEIDPLAKYDRTTAPR